MDIEVPFETVDDSHVHIWAWDAAPAALREGLTEARFVVYVPCGLASMDAVQLGHRILNGAVGWRIEGDWSTVVSTDLA